MVARARARIGSEPVAACLPQEQFDFGLLLDLPRKNHGSLVTRTLQRILQTLDLDLLPRNFSFTFFLGLLCQSHIARELSFFTRCLLSLLLLYYPASTDAAPRTVNCF